jgi:Tfp pilus assembly protein FimT
MIEVIIVVVLLASLLAISVPAIRASTGANLRRAAAELASTLRYTYQESSLTNLPMRLAYDLDNNTWWVEAADGEALMFRNRDERTAFAEFLADKRESDERVQKEVEQRRAGAKSEQQIMQEIFGEDGASGGGMGGMGGLLGSLFGGGAMGPAARGGEFNPNEFRPVGEQGQLDDDAFKPRDLPRGIRFLGVWSPQYEDMVEPMDEFAREAMLSEAPEDQRWTVVYTHAFPGGYLEDSVVYLTDENGNSVISLTVEPLLGRVDLVYGQVAPPDLRDREQR